MIVSEDLLAEAQKNITNTWLELFGKPFLPNRNKPIEKKELRQPMSQLVTFIIYIFSLETFVYS